MLCAKTLKAAKAALIFILGAWATMSAQAAMNISGGATHTPGVYAAETVSTKAFNDLVATNGTFTVTAWSDVTLGDATRYYRFDLTGATGSAVFGSGIAAASFNVGATVAANGTITGGTAATALSRARATDLVFEAGGAIGASEVDTTTGVRSAGSATTALVLDLNGAHPTGPDPDTPTNIIAMPDEVRAGRVMVKGAASSGTYKYMLRLRIYENLSDALSAGDSTLYDSEGTPIVVIDPTLTASVKEVATEDAPLIADVLHNFTKFQSGSAGTTSGDLATVTLNLKSVHCSTGANTDDGAGCKNDKAKVWPIFPAGTEGTGAKIGIGHVLGEGSLTVLGDHSLVDLKLGAGTLTLRDGTRTALEKYTEGDNAGMYKDRSLAADAHIALTAPGAMTLTANVGAKNTSTIPPSSYTATVALKPANSDAAPVAGVSGAKAGVISTNGTMVHLGYLTGHDGYNQRVIIANRGTVDAAYMVPASSILTEDGTMASPGKMATGTVPAGSQMVIKTKDLISFDSGMTRAAATISLTAPTSAISVSTTIVNLGDGSTDTSSHMVQ